VNRCPKSVNPTLVLFNDEALYHLNEHVNSQNGRYRSAENSMLHHKVPLHDVMFGVWCTTGITRIIWPFFYCRPCSHTNTLHTFWHLFPYTHINITRESMPFSSSSQCKKFNLLIEGFWWKNSKQMTAPAQFLLVQHVNPLVLKLNYSSSEPSAHF